MSMGSINPSLHTHDRKFRVLVTWVGQNDTIADEQEEGVMESVFPGSGRNYMVSGYSLSTTASGIIPHITIPQEVMGSFKLPQVGDVIWVEQSRRSNDSSVKYVFSSYSSTEEYGTLPPQWGSRPGDYGHLRTYKDHNVQFLPTTPGADFVTKYIRSITGYRFRHFYKNNLIDKRFVVRGDPVFDVDPDDISKPYLINEGSYLIEGGNLEDDKGRYPEPLNVPREREEEEKYSYLGVVYSPLEEGLVPDGYDNIARTSKKDVTVIKNVLNTKNYLSYQPVMDKTYLEEANFEREIPAAEEYQVVLRGNNKLLIQDQHGDGEQLIITLKSQYDEQFTIVHNGERGQVRVRDHLGQGVLLDGDPEAPRVISWTANKQVIEQGSVKDIGEFTYIRNGPVFGDSQTSFGTKTGLAKEDVANQEFLMVSTPEIIAELSSRLSSGMSTFAGSKGSPGVYIRNNVDPNTSSQEWGMFQVDSEFTVVTKQENIGHEGSVQKTELEQKMDGTSVVQTLTLAHDSPGTMHGYTEVTEVSGSMATKNSTLDRNGGEASITTSESVLSDSLVTASRTLTNSDSTQVDYSESADGAIPSAVYTLLSSGNPASIMTMNLDTIQTTKHNAGGAAVSTVTQSIDGTIDVSRTGPGLSMPINIGSDGGSGAITVGNSLAPLVLDGLTVNVTGDTSVGVNAPAISITGDASVAIKAPAVSIDP